MSACIYPRFSTDGIGTYVNALSSRLGVPVIDGPGSPLMPLEFLAPPPRGFELVHVPHFVQPLTMRGAKSVCTIHDLTPLVLEGAYRGAALAYLRFRIAWSVRHADHLICISDHTRRDVARLFGRTLDTTVIPVAAEEPVTAETRVEPAYPYRYFLCVGRRRMHKNTHRCIAALAHGVIDPDVHLVLAGKPDVNDTSLRRLAAELGVLERVHFTGGLTVEQLAGHYHSALALLFPSLYEGFGLPILEAMSYGCPVITSNASALPDTAGDAALLIDPAELGELVGAMERILHSEALRRDLSARGTTHAKQFSWDTTAARTAEVYEATLAGR